MNTQPNVYYIPKNPHVKAGKIYTFYLNNNTNLDLSTILNFQTAQLQDLIKKNLSSTKKKSIIITDDEYQQLIDLNEKVTKLIEERDKNIQEFIQKETTATTELIKINTERQNLIKILTKVGNRNVK
ncbi:MAG: hypothetical protein PUD25_03495 [Bacilli bacterium]|nr:hypothetical protein [Bacilli bacterium]